MNAATATMPMISVASIPLIHTSLEDCKKKRAHLMARPPELALSRAAVLYP